MLVALPYCDLGIMVYVVLGSYSTKTKEKGTKLSIQEHSVKGILTKFQCPIDPNVKQGLGSF